MALPLTQLIFAAVVGSVGLCIVIMRRKSSKEIEKYRKCCEKFDYEDQSKIVELQDGQQIRVAQATPVKNDTQIQYLTNFVETCKTMYDVFPNGAKLSVDGICLGNIRPSRDGMDWTTYSDFLRRSKLIADGLLTLGLSPRETFGIYSMNSTEYTMFEYACYRHSMIVIPIYETLGSNVCGFISKQAQLKAIFCDKLNRVENILQNVAEFETLKHIIVCKTESKEKLDDLRAKVQAAGLQLHSMEDIEKCGAENVVEDHPPALTDLAVICYTSGTTDAPKGVMLSHQNVIAGFSAILAHLSDYRLNEHDTVISYLPLGHMFERICEWGTLSMGGKVGYFGGDIKRLSDDMKVIQPTMFPCVPRVLNKIYSRVQEQASKSFIKRTLISWAYSAKRKQYHARQFDNNTIWDSLVFSKIRALLGGKVRLIPVGSAPMNANVLDFLRCALGCNILEGYGQTECVAGATVTLIGDFTTGHVGVPLRSAAIKLEDVPDMGYFVKEGKGEILIKGSIVFQGYYKDPKKTAETIDNDGWLHTGDIGTFTDNGSLKILDRKKDIFKLSQGEYIAPAKIEDIYAQNPYILQIFVYGDSYKSCLVGIVVPNPEMLSCIKQKNGVANGNGVHSGSGDSGVSTPESLKKFIFDQLIADGKKGGLYSYEQVKDICIENSQFTIEDGLLTPTLKNKRFALKKHYQPQIDAMYSKLERLE